MTGASQLEMIFRKKSQIWSFNKKNLTKALCGGGKPSTVEKNSLAATLKEILCYTKRLESIGIFRETKILSFFIKPFKEGGGKIIYARFNGQVTGILIQVKSSKFSLIIIGGFSAAKDLGLQSKWVI